RKKRIDDLLTIAKACEYLGNLDKYGSQQAVAKTVGLSSEMIRQFLNVLKLPEEIQELVSKREIDSVDIVKEIAAINDPSRQIAVAHAFVNSLSKDVRDIKRLIKSANLPIGDAKKAIINAKPKGLHIFIIDFEDEMHRAIIKEAETLKIKPADLVKKIIADWLKRKSSSDKQ
ncbi:MAG: hypothetical protein ABIH71_05355, partial [Candidatus Omnitrophota bacterium]